MGTKKRAASPAALVRADHGVSEAHLTKAERSVLDEALRQGEDLREEVEAAVLRYGRWLLEKVFDDDTTAALDDKSHNAIWQELVRRAGGPTLRITRHMLYVAVRIAANDRRITAQAWQGLDAVRKELLLPLKAQPLMLEAAKHVTQMNLSQSKTREYVTNMLQGQGRSRQVRITPRGLRSRVRALHEGLAGATVLKRVKSFRSEMAPSERAALARDVSDLRDLLAEIARHIK